MENDDNDEVVVTDPSLSTSDDDFVEPDFDDLEDEDTAEDVLNSGQYLDDILSLIHI